jgi:hypothetical protein
MIELEKKYLSPGLAKKCTYFSQVIYKEGYLKGSFRYSLRKSPVRKPKIISLDCLDKSVFSMSAKNTIVKFLFRIKEYDPVVFSRHRKPYLKPGQLNLKNIVSKIKRHLTKGEFLTGCALKKVKGGFTIDLGGLLCFMPYSLAEVTRFIPYAPKALTVQLFQVFGLSLVSMKEQELFLNVILSRKQSTPFLKSLLKIFFQSGVFDNTFSFLKKIDCLVTKNTRLRLIGNTLKKNKGLLKLVKEVFVF